MKKCIPCTSDRIITALAAVVCAVAAFFSCRELLCGGQPPAVFFAMTLLFGGVAIHTIWRMIYMGNWGFFYDDEKICPVKITVSFDGMNYKMRRRTFKGFPAQSPGTLNFDKNTAKDIFHEVFGEDFGKCSKNGSK